ncbi:MAG: hypothetical protein ACAI34_23010 [Verrucomicrobium sp.]|nr:hypothetical protein [Verrucomicrobium sp.]
MSPKPTSSSTATSDLGPIKHAPAFDFYPERWLAGVALMSDQDQLTYLRLLCHAWLRDGLPADEAALKRLAGRKVSPEVLAKFPIGVKGQRRNPRQEIIRQEQLVRLANSAHASAVKAWKRWNPGKELPPHLLTVAAYVKSREVGVTATEAECDAPQHAAADAAAHAPADAVAHAAALPTHMPGQCPPLTTHRPPLSQIQSSSSSNAGAGACEAGVEVKAEVQLEDKHETATGGGEVPSPPAPSPDPDVSPSAPGSGISGSPFAGVDEITAYGAVIGASPECCESFWQKCEGQGWRTDRNVPIHDWKPLLARYRKRWDELQFQEKQLAARCGGGSTGMAGRSPGMGNPRQSRQAGFLSVPSSPEGLQSGWGSRYQKSHS